MIRALTRLFVVSSLLLSLSGGWSVFQIVAWVQMIDERAEVMGYSNAVVSVIAGGSPCFRCDLIREQRRGQEESPLAPKISQLKPPALIAIGLGPEVWPPVSNRTAVSWLATRPPGSAGDRPPVPPPRSA